VVIVGRSWKRLTSAPDPVDPTAPVNEIALMVRMAAAVACEVLPGCYWHQPDVHKLEAQRRGWQAHQPSGWTVLRDLKGIAVYVDDIFIIGKTEKEYLSNLKTILIRLKEAGFK